MGRSPVGGGADVHAAAAVRGSGPRHRDPPRGQRPPGRRGAAPAGQRREPAAHTAGRDSAAGGRGAGGHADGAAGRGGRATPARGHRRASAVPALGAERRVRVRPPPPRTADPAPVAGRIDRRAAADPAAGNPRHPGDAGGPEPAAAPGPAGPGRPGQLAQRSDRAGRDRRAGGLAARRAELPRGPAPPAHPRRHLRQHRPHPSPDPASAGRPAGQRVSLVGAPGGRPRATGRGPRGRTGATGRHRGRPRPGRTGRHSPAVGLRHLPGPDRPGTTPAHRGAAPDEDGGVAGHGPAAGGRGRRPLPTAWPAAGPDGRCPGAVHRGGETPERGPDAGPVGGPSLRMGDGDQGLATARWALGTGRLDPLAASRTRTQVAIGALEVGGPTAALAELGQLDADPARVRPLDAERLAFRGLVWLLAGDLSQATADATTGLAMARAGAPLTLGLQPYGYLALTQYLAGRWDDALLTSGQASSIAVIRAR